MLVDMQELLTYEDVSRITKFKINTLRKWVRTRKIPFIKLNGSIRFSPEAIQVWKAGKETGGKGAEKNGAVTAPADRSGELFPEARGV
jgi:hypothetical protein